MAIEINFPYKRNTIDPKPRKLFRSNDADTIVIAEQPLRLVSCDTPEKAAYAGKPEKSQPLLDICKERLNNGFYGELPTGLRDYFSNKITSDAAKRHIDAAMDATEVFERMLSERLTLPDGNKRKIAVMPTGDLIDIYGRMLAYVSPWYQNNAEDPLPPVGDPRRNTLNLDMISNGWAAFFPIFPSLPNNRDMNITIKAADEAWTEGKGAWEKYGKSLLLGYEYRMCIKLSEGDKSASECIADAFERVCVDLRNLSIVGKFDFYNVPPSHRLWIWEEDLEQAKKDLNL
jgi:endonuclease YncB( thermonuclease family)